VFVLLLVSVLSLTPQTMTHTALLEQARQTLDLIYNMQFTEALQAAQKLSDRAPNHPAGAFYRAATYWQWRTLALETRQQQALLQSFDTASSQALQLAARLPTAQATEAAFYLGAIYGVRARMYFVQRQYFKALHAAKQGGQYLQQCVTNDPHWYDAYAGLGTYHYVLSRVPGFWRGIVQGLIGMLGDRQKGLQELELARTKGPLSGPEAASILTKIYALPQESQLDRAVELLEHLAQRYPQNFDYRYRLAYLYASLGQWKKAHDFIQSLLAALNHGHPYYPSQWVPILQYRLAEVEVLQGQADAAALRLQALQPHNLEPHLQAWINLRLGNVYDLRGSRQKAQETYARVEGDHYAERLARRYRTTPFTPGPGMLKELEETI
jgi:predicted Zn-dependent protease